MLVINHSLLIDALFQSSAITSLPVKGALPARQYSGTAGRRENSQVGVFLLYAGQKGAAFIDRALYLPEEWTADRLRCREAGIPDQVEFATKGTLAKQMLDRAFAAGVKADWVLADTVYGYDEMRKWLEDQWQPYVLAVPETHQVWSGGEPQEVGRLSALLPSEAWVVLSAGDGSQGARLYEWAWMQLPYTGEGKEGWHSWVVVRAPPLPSGETSVLPSLGACHDSAHDPGPSCWFAMEN